MSLRNNHLRQHRDALREVASKQPVPTRLLALNWAVAEKPQATIHRICGDRVTHRGDNHQTLRADAAKSHEEVIWMFINTTEELTRSEVDAIVGMDMEEGLEEAVRRAVDGVVRVVGVKRPAEEKIKEALDVVKGYKPAMKKPDEPAKKGKTSGARYYGLLPEFDLEAVLEEQLKQADGGAHAKAKEAFESLKKGGRVTKRPHVTVVHSKSLPEEKNLWDECTQLNGLGEPPLFKGRLGNLVWNDRVMALTVDDLDVDAECGAAAGKAFLQGLHRDLTGRLHITVGTTDPSILPVEAKDLVEAFRKGNDVGKSIHSVQLEDVTLRGRIKGLYA